MRIACAIAAVLACLAEVAAGQPLRLRGDAYVSAEPPVGLLVLQADGKEGQYVDAEALVWTGADHIDDEGTGDALVITMRVRDPQGRGEARIGRFLIATGAIRPIHIDGASVIGKSPWGQSVQLFGGMPAVPRFGVDSYDWLVGTRIAQSHRDFGTAGISYYHQRDGGDLADEEIGIDYAITPTKWLDVGSKVAFDLVHPGLADLHVSAAANKKKWRLEAFGARRSPSRILPATSLFSALGDVPSDQLGSGIRWRAAPRLDVWSELAYRSVGDDDGFHALARTILRLDDRGKGAVGLELRRNHLGDDSSWTGIRATARQPIRARWMAQSEIELVVPDDSRGRGTLWPWALFAVAWQPAELWETAAAIEAYASPTSELAMSVLARLTRRWEAP